MKGAAKCDKQCELQNSVNQQGFERILCFWDIPESMPASVSTLMHSVVFVLIMLCEPGCSCLPGCLVPLTCGLHRSCFHVQQTHSAEGLRLVVLFVDLCLNASAEAKLSKDMKLGQHTR